MISWNRREALSAAALAALAPSMSLAQEAGSGWETLPTEPYPGKRDDIAFADPMHGWYGTGKGELFHTVDGGNTWRKVASRPGTFIRALGFIDARTGFIGNIGTDYYPGVTDQIPLYRTDDAGVTWAPVDLGGRTIGGVCAIDILRAQRIHQGALEERVVIHAAGRVGGPSGILRSVDGGAEWTVRDMTAEAGMILDVKFLDEQTGLVFASTTRDPTTTEGLILRTADGGASWTPVYRSGRRGELIWKASFVDARVGYATVQSYDTMRDQQLVVKTTDGGLTWAELPLVMNAKARQFGIGFVDEMRGWVGTMVGGFETRDGGATFTPSPVAPAANKFRVVGSGASKAVFAIGSQVQRIIVG